MVPRADRAPAKMGALSRSATPTTCRPARAGFASGPTMFITVGIASSRLTGPTWRMAGCIWGAYMNTIPASSSARFMTGSVASMGTPSASSTSALPLREVNDRFPCFAIRTPAPAATIAAAVEILNVDTAPPPVPQVSTSESGSSTSSATMTDLSALTTPATISGLSPVTRRADSNAATCTPVASPCMMMPKAASASAPESCSWWASFWIAPCSAFSRGAPIFSDLERGGLFSRCHDLKHFLDHFLRVLARHRFLERLLDPVDNVALGLQRLTLGVQLDVSFLELGNRDPDLLLDRRQSLRRCPRLHGRDLDRPF